VLPESLEPLRTEGFNALFNMDYDTARARFEEMIKLEPDHPAGHTYLANAIWLGHLASLRRLQTGVYNRGDSFFVEKEDLVDPKVDKQFREAINKAVALAEAQLKKNKKDLSALYYLGIARNIAAGYEATVKRSFFSALRNGSKGVDMHRDLLELDPSCVDAKLSVGMYHYVVGSLPFAVKLLVFFGGVHGSKKEGLAELEEVADKGNYARDEAAVLLVMLYNREKRLEPAYKLLERLSKAYPGNSLFQLEMANTLGQMGKLRDAFAQFEKMLADPAVMAYMPDLVHYRYGESLFDARSWDKAAEQFAAAAREPKAPDALATISHLKAGECLDLQGKRSEAIAQYKIVLSRNETLDAQDQARKYLKTPYRSQ
jgi:tetratricopeptide (TPR) repeat protein